MSIRVKVPAIAKHLKNIYESGELERGATVSKMEIVQSEGDREVAREIEFYNLDGRAVPNQDRAQIKLRLDEPLHADSLETALTWRSSRTPLPPPGP
jgi:hypothetical protein